MTWPPETTVNSESPLKTAEKPNVLYLVTASIKEDGSIYYPTFMRSQIQSLEGYIGKAVVVPLTGNTSPAKVKKAIAECKELIRKNNIHIVHAMYGSMTAFIGSRARGEAALVVSFCGDDLLGSRNKGVVWRVRNALMVYLSKRAAAQAAAIIVKSRNLWKALPPRSQKKAQIIPNGVNIEGFKVIARAEARHALRWEETEKIVVFNPSSGANQSVKNLPLALKTIEHLNQSYPVQLELIQHKTPNEVSLMMNAADALLVTSLHEGSPNIVKEAMAVNLPVVTVSCGDVKERLEGVDPGAVVPDYEAEALAEALHQVLEQNHRSNGRERLKEQGLSTGTVRDRILKIYNQIL